ncbi:unnamed protein product [Closterium sp. Yama58-4]|nr:unnamed protein product [Closterium sp. Yama58-4]
MGDLGCGRKKALLEEREQQLKAYHAARWDRLHLQASLMAELTGEIASKHLSAKVRARKARTQIAELNVGGTTVGGPRPVLEAALVFFTNIFGRDRRTDFTKWKVIPNRCLQEGLATFLEADWREEEVKRAFAAMAKRKSPGSDGLPKELFEVQWDLLGGSFMAMARNFQASTSLHGARSKCHASSSCKDWHLLLHGKLHSLSGNMQGSILGSWARRGANSCAALCEGAEHAS